jgi:hypothetical protein
MARALRELGLEFVERFEPNGAVYEVNLLQWLAGRMDVIAKETGFAK